MKFTKRRFQNAKFCPFCGTATLERDRYGESKIPPCYKLEFICSSCGWGVQLIPSLRHQLAANLAKSHRQQRPSERTVKPKPDDPKLHLLQRYVERIQMPYTIRRSNSRPGRFVFCSLDGKSRGSLGFDKAKILIRGFELSQIAENVNVEDGDFPSSKSLPIPVPVGWVVYPVDVSQKAEAVDSPSHPKATEDDSE